jgi:hypothetical protein
MAGKNTAAFGIYRDRATVEAAIDVLRDRGFRNEDISVLMPQNLGSKDLGTKKATKGPEGTAAGAGAGAAVGGTLGLLTSLGVLTIPGVGPLLAAGPLVATLAGMGAGGAVGGLTGGLIGLGIPEYEAKRYEGRVLNGGILLSVHCDDSEWTGRAKDTLRQTGAEDVSSSGEKAADYAKSDRPLPRSATGDVTAYESDWRQHYATTMAGSSATYEEYAPAYQFGQRMAEQAQYRGRPFNEVEPELRREYEREYPGNTWDRMRESIRYAWERITGKATRRARA